MRLYQGERRRRRTRTKRNRTAVPVLKSRACGYVGLRQGPTVRYVRRRWSRLLHFHTTSSWIWPEQMFVLSGIKHRTVHSIVAVRLVYAERRASMPPCWLKRSISPRTHNHTIHSHGWVNKNVKTFTSVTYVNLGTRPQPLVGSKMDLMAQKDI